MKNNLINLFACLICSLLLFPRLALSENFILHSYEEGESSYAISAKLIDLASATIISSLDLPLDGTIINKEPIQILSNDSPMYICFTVDGWMGKNAGFFDSSEVVRYCIYTVGQNSLRILHSDSLKYVRFEYLYQYIGEQGFRLAIASATSDNYLFRPGRYSINDRFNIELISPIDENDLPPRYIDQTGNFKHLDRMPHSDKYHLYHTFHNSQYWLLKLNGQNDNIVDSLLLRTSGGQATTYAYSPSRDRFYCLHTNYEIHGELVEKNRNDFYIEPEVLIYDPNNLHLLQRYAIQDYPDGNFPGKENGVADVITDYLVYYFFEDDNWKIYAPAMLFIFDTRTNEASWLRVGWR